MEKIIGWTILMVMTCSGFCFLVNEYGLQNTILFLLFCMTISFLFTLAIFLINGL